ncbi:helix-turn-helix transcriptional regulator [Roseomonas chloroacetimidivorans]|uniref:helix-turn-helix transcriptional regulator n=1 Tax=Roseomonas chloroacetimidivorans TaxID=1766656 RepID=UPI003C771F51
MPGSSSEGTEAERRNLGEKIGRFMRQQGMTQAQLALKAGYDERTIRNVLSGKPTRPRTVHHICEAVGLKDVGRSTFDVAEFADEAHGAYCSRTTAHYVGFYEGHRWSYDRSRRIVRSLFELSWSAEAKCMVFAEHQRYRDDAGRLVDFSQRGEMFSSENTGLIHLLTMWDGMLRVATLTKLAKGETTLRGVVLTQARLSFFRQPAVSPLVLRKMGRAPASEAEMAALMGEIAPGTGGYDVLARELREAERDVILSTFAMPGANDQEDGARFAATTHWSNDVTVAPN